MTERFISQRERVMSTLHAQDSFEVVDIRREDDVNERKGKAYDAADIWVAPAEEGKDVAVFARNLLRTVQPSTLWSQNGGESFELKAFQRTGSRSFEVTSVHIVPNKESVPQKTNNK